MSMNTYAPLKVAYTKTPTELRIRRVGDGKFEPRVCLLMNADTSDITNTDYTLGGQVWIEGVPTEFVIDVPRDVVDALTRRNSR